MSETTPGETPVERRLREMSKELERFDPADALTLDAGREALALLREVMADHDSVADFDPVASDALEKRVRALLARCEGDR